jgi:cysteine desulfurase/selenocysteine lyase
MSNIDLSKIKDLNKIKEDFPILGRKVYDHPLVYLDNAATSQKPQLVLDTLVSYYSKSNANVHRGIHTLSEEATDLYENARKEVGKFIGSRNEKEIIFTKGTTDGLNALAIRLGDSITSDDEIVTTDFEHHSNFIPWLLLAKKTGAKSVVVESDEQGLISIDKFREVINNKTRIVALAHASNVLGTILPVKEISKIAHENGALLVIDGAQAIPHLKVNVESLGCDFYCFSGHKMLGPTGIGVLWGRSELLDKLEPFEYGGGMIDEVSYSDATWAHLPEKFEAGTPNIAGAIGLGAACSYLASIGMENVREHELDLLRYTFEKLALIPSLKILGPRDIQQRTGLVSFTIEGIHSHDLASVLSALGIAVRSGHHCTMPYHNKHKISASTRVSYYIYNTVEDVDKLIIGINEAIKTLKL